MFPECAVDKYEGAGLTLCKNVARLEMYPKARSRKPGGMVGRAGKR
jgi:hypothetical protein